MSQGGSRAAVPNKTPHLHPAEGTGSRTGSRPLPMRPAASRRHAARGRGLAAGSTGAAAAAMSGCFAEQSPLPQPEHGRLVPHRTPSCRPVRYGVWARMYSSARDAGQLLQPAHKQCRNDADVFRSLNLTATGKSNLQNTELYTESSRIQVNPASAATNECCKCNRPTIRTWFGR